jgi:hypothetical protein
MNCLTCSIKTWVSDPLPEKASAVDWLLFAGLMAVAGVLWTRLLKHIDVE